MSGDWVDDGILSFYMEGGALAGTQKRCIDDWKNEQSFLPQTLANSEDLEIETITTIFRLGSQNTATINMGRIVTEVLQEFYRSFDYAKVNEKLNPSAQVIKCDDAVAQAVLKQLNQNYLTRLRSIP